VPELVALAERLTASYALDSLFNIQVRYAGSTPKLLEINARMSGGVYFACLSGLNLPAWAIAIALGDRHPDELPVPRSGISVHQQFHEFIFPQG
jgi:biotin carboxylase